VIQDTKAELLAALSHNALELQRAAVKILGTLSDSERQQIINRVTELQTIQQVLERKLLSVNNSPAAHCWRAKNNHPSGAPMIFAYIDPALGSMVLQAVAGVFFAGVVICRRAIVSPINRFCSWFGIATENSADSLPDEESQCG
jgi:hypothetical protein